MGVQQFSSVILIRSKTGERLTPWMVSHSHHWSDLLNLKDCIATHKLNGYSTILVSSSDPLIDWRATHFLNGCSAILIIGSDLLKDWRATYTLNGCSAIPISGSDLLKDRRETHSLDRHSAIISAQRLERNSHPGWVSAALISGSD